MQTTFEKVIHADIHRSYPHFNPFCYKGLRVFRALWADFPTVIHLIKGYIYPQNRKNTGGQPLFIHICGG